MHLRQFDHKTKSKSACLCALCLPELEKGKGVFVALEEVDQSSEVIGEVTMLNTLKHYQVRHEISQTGTHVSESSSSSILQSVKKQRNVYANQLTVQMWLSSILSNTEDI